MGSRRLMGQAQCCESDVNPCKDGSALPDVTTQRVVPTSAPPNPPSPIDVFNPGLREKTERSNFAIDVDRGGNTLGLGLKFVERKLLVNQVKPGGAIETYNAANPDNSIRKEDLIVCVNDIELDPAKMVREIQMKSKLRLVVERPL